VHRIIVVTGTDTGVGKTFLTALLAAHLCARGVKVAALKPICSGGREDARVLREAQQGELRLDEINPWHFRAPLAPILAARREKKTVSLREVIAHAHAFWARFEVVLIEGAGGLLTPLGERFNTANFIRGLGADALVVAPNRLGTVNQVLLTVRALPLVAAQRARIVLMSPKRADAATRTNPALLSELLGEGRVHVLPHLAHRATRRAMAKPELQTILNALLA
jgi:dethiobiotin synthetase